MKRRIDQPDPKAHNRYRRTRRNSALFAGLAILLGVSLSATAYILMRATGGLGTFLLQSLLAMIVLIILLLSYVLLMANYSHK